MSTLLSAPLFKILPASEAKQYGNVSNRLEVSLKGKTVYHYIEVGTSLFSIMLHQGVPRESQVTLFLDVLGKHAVFGFMVDDEGLVDLWSQSSKLLPGWIGNERHWSIASDEVSE